jgi:hypothetical protein
MKNAVFWDVTLCGSCKNRRFGGTYRLHHKGDKNRRARNNTIQQYTYNTLHKAFLSSVLRLLVTVNIVPSSDSCHPDYGGARSSETSVLTRATRFNSDLRENLKSYIALTDWAL